MFNNTIFEYVIKYLCVIIYLKGYLRIVNIILCYSIIINSSVRISNYGIEHILMKFILAI